ncbi:invasion associated locus B family protein [Ruegeria sediminis]|uniref:Invasion associated locus B family protein n=1 Tax=Ruegeria sediminis TaxID=2583820 RepID=A0ABY2WZX8_9RHOB|nr:invasion associated locus B family protein [Ruegeria sediminis]TMV08540.1 invasion associated locus B family protein [Ruegeria sediminis]
MFKKLIPLSAVALTVWSGLAAAQDTTTSTEEQTESQSSAGALDLGQPVNGEPQAGQRYSKEKFGDWDLACIKTNTETDPCSLLQILEGSEGNAIAEISMFRLPEAEGQRAVAAATVIVPLETLLPAQLTISVDDAPGKRYNYTFCAPIGCVAQIGLTQADIDAMKKGAKATLSLVPATAPDQVINLDLSLSGFTAGYDVVDVATN